jgi:hypothetical protein
VKSPWSGSLRAGSAHNSKDTFRAPSFPAISRIRPPAESREVDRQSDSGAILVLMATASACSFCGKARGRVKQLIRGPQGVAICDECVFLSVQLLDQEGIFPPTEAPRLE